MKKHRISIRIGSPFWKLFACIGAPLYLRVTTYFDRESSTYCAYSSDLDGLAVCADSFPNLIDETRLAADNLIDLAVKFRLRSPLQSPTIHITEINRKDYLLDTSISL